MSDSERRRLREQDEQDELEVATEIDGMGEVDEVTEEADDLDLSPDWLEST